MVNVLEMKEINKKFPRFELKNINLQLKKGSVMGLIGANGAGKTTIIKSIMGLSNIDSGEILVLGEEILKKPIIKDKVGLVYDEILGFPNYTIEKNKNIIKEFYLNWEEDKFRFYLKKFKLDPFEKIKNLSKGSRMKYSLAIALSHKAELLILDEPTAGLDAVVRADFLDILFELVEKEEISILYSTHITGDLEKIADYITFVKDGKIEFSLEIDKLLEKIVVVKGSLEDLTEKIKEKIKGIRKHKYGFEGITIFKELLGELNENLIFEEANLDEIIVGFTKDK